MSPGTSRATRALPPLLALCLAGLPAPAAETKAAPKSAPKPAPRPAVQTITQTVVRAIPLSVTHGIASGDPGPASVVVWGRVNARARMWVDFLPLGAPPRERQTRQGPVAEPVGDFTASLLVDGLKPDTDYLYWVRFTSPDALEGVVSETGSFRTLPVETSTRALTLVWWGDLGGQGYCRRPEKGYALFRLMEEAAPDLALAVGDSVYADGACPPRPGLAGQSGNALSPDPETAAYQGLSAASPGLSPAETIAAMRAKWKYNLEDEAYRRFRARTPHLYQWDDHEVLDDWSPGEARLSDLRKGGDARPVSELSNPGRRSFLEYSPLLPGLGARLYRSVAYGRTAEIFVLDTRSHRSANALPDGAGKSMLGAAQRDWLLQGLKAAQARGARWKIIATSDPLSSPTGGLVHSSPDGTPLYEARDGWAAGPAFAGKAGPEDPPNPSGFESELRTILSFIKSEGIRDVLWLTGDAHHARVARYEPAGDLQGLVFHELMAGPVSAASGSVAAPSRTFSPVELFAWGVPAGGESPDHFNFGWLRIGEDGALRAEIRGPGGELVKDSQQRPGLLELKPASP